MMCKIFPHATFQGSLKTFNDTGFSFRILCSEKKNESFWISKNLKVFVFKFGTFVSLQTLRFSSTF